jgi:DNA-binding NarL/FixJ family response regulator
VAKSKIHIKIIIADDHQLFRDGLKNSLKKFDDIEVIGEAGNGKVLLDMLTVLQPDIITLDINMPVMNGLEVLPIIKKRFPGIKVIVVSFYNEPSIIAKMMELGANCYLTPEGGGDMVYKAVIECMENGFFINNTIRKSLLSVYYPVNNTLSVNEKKILELLSRGYTEMGISEKVGLSRRTVSAIIDKLKKKSNTCTAGALIAYMKREKLIGQ